VDHCPVESEPKDEEHSSQKEQSFNDVWKSHAPELFRRCLTWMGGNSAEAEEAFSRAAVNIFRGLRANGRSMPDPRPWLLRLTHNACMDVHRENKRRGEKTLGSSFEWDRITAEEDQAPVSPMHGQDPERLALAKERHDFLLRSIDILPSRLRETVLYKLSFQTSREVADRLRITEENVRKRLQKARTILRRRLLDYESGRTARPAKAPRERPSAVRPPARRRGDGPIWKVHALCPAQARLASGLEIEAVLALGYPPRQSSARRRKSLEEYIRLHPQGSKKRLELGRHFLEQGDLDAAVSQLEILAGQQPRRLQPWMELVECYRLSGRPDDAAAACERALAGIAGEAERHFLWGLREQLRGHVSEAERAFLAFSEARPDQPAPRVALAKLRLANGRPSEAALDLGAALAIDPEDAEALSLGHEAMRLLGRSAEARGRALRALELDSANAVALPSWFTARCRATGGRLAPESSERRWIARLQDWARTRAGARRALAFRHLCRGDLAAAGALLESLARSRPRLPQAWIEWARVLDYTGRPLEALRALDEAGALRSPDRDLRLLSCRLAARAGLAERALPEIDGLLRRYGEAWDVAAACAWALTVLGREPGRARELSETAAARQPELPAAWIEHGRVLARWDQPRAALEAFTTAWELLPREDGFDLAAPVALGLSDLRRRLGDPDAATFWARHALTATDSLRRADPARSELWWRQTLVALAGRAREVSTPSAPASFSEAEARWDRVAQLSEPLLG
jgi:RNA polymerase sigma factor (sigma-70 family)